jgi:hypothetical protein
VGHGKFIFYSKETNYNFLIEHMVSWMLQGYPLHLNVLRPAPLSYRGLKVQLNKSYAVIHSLLYLGTGFVGHDVV